MSRHGCSKPGNGRTSSLVQHVPLNQQLVWFGNQRFKERLNTPSFRADQDVR